MNKTITLFALAFITTLALASAVSAYHVKVEWTMDQYAYDFEAYRCTDSICSTVDPTPIMSGNTGSASRGIVTEYYTSGTAYHAFYFYKNGYRVNNYIVKTTKEYDGKYSDTFKKKDSCTSAINSVTISPSVLNAGDVLNVTANIQSAFTVPSASSGMPIYAPTTHTSFFSADVRVNITVQNSTNQLYFSTSVMSILEGINRNITFSAGSVPECTISVTISTEIVDSQCDLTNAVPQSTTTLIHVGHVNAAPVITTLPDTSATVGVLYNYDINATDAEGDSITYSLTTAPAGMTINSATGMISWTPSAVGSFPVNVSASDGTASTSQGYTLVVTAVSNNAPVIITSPVTSAAVNATYTYDINATDADGDTLTYSLDIFPAGMTINSATGMISWTPSAVGNYTVRIVVSDGIDNANQLYDVVVSNGSLNNTAPHITITNPSNNSVFDDHDVIPLRASVSDAEEIGLSALWISSLDGNLGTGNSIYRTLSEGTHTITARVTDSGGLSASYSIILVIEAYEDGDEHDAVSTNYLGEYINVDGLLLKGGEFYNNFTMRLGKAVQQSQESNLLLFALMLLVMILLIAILLIMLFRKK